MEDEGGSYRWYETEDYTRMKRLQQVMLTLFFDGRWNKDKKFVYRATYGLLINPNASYCDLLYEIRGTVELQQNVNILSISYQIDETFEPTIIDNDQSVRFYLHLKTGVKSEVGKYPLCIQIENDKVVPDVDMDCHSDTWEEVGQSEFNLNDEYPRTDVAMTRNSEVCTGPPSTAGQLTTCSTSSLLSCMDGSRSEILDGMDTTLRINGLYPSKEEFKETLQIYALHNKFEFETKTSNPWVLHVICVDQNCKWAVRGVRIKESDYFQIKRFDNVHSCSIDYRLGANRQATAAVIGKLIKHQYLDASRKPYQPKAIMADLSRELGLNVSYKKAWRGKERALTSISGTNIESYGKLPTLCYMLKKTNPGSLVLLDTDKKGNFKTLFMSLGAWREGWAFCRPVISVDGSFLKAKFRGTILSACSLDANRQIFPVAFGICERENKESWSWFFNKLKEAIGVRADLCIVSDRNEGLIRAAQDIYPEADHGHCVQHILGNITSKYKGNSKRVTTFFNAAARAATERKWEYFMKLLDAEDPQIRQFLEKIGHDKWARCKFARRRYSMVTSNNAESLNAMDATAREYPISMLIEFLRSRMQTWFHDRRKLAIENNSKLSLAAEEVLVNLLNDSTGMIVRPSTAYLFEVIDKACRAYIVDLLERTCTCKEFQLEDFVCVHAVAAIAHRKGLSCYDFVSEYYKNSAWLNAYSGVVYPLGEYSVDDIPMEDRNRVVKPPISDKKTAGRPKNKRIPSKGEFVSRQTCGRCKQHGHNQKTCHNPIPRVPR
ncbi:unnamed protein product [Cuscuta epithymum]|uniref:SWIM-type domain-containing protein n=1 Tax=Cuscuta epithymum TaxID=186058 RepID=A0AAV0CYR3_9ASTE|nr:unnamed protein product [Cuscuta epithymum]